MSGGCTCLGYCVELQVHQNAILNLSARQTATEQWSESKAQRERTSLAGVSSGAGPMLVSPSRMQLARLAHSGSMALGLVSGWLTPSWMLRMSTFSSWDVGPERVLVVWNRQGLFWSRGTWSVSANLLVGRVELNQLGLSAVMGAAPQRATSSRPSGRPWSRGPGCF